jgi:hypothetical protein
MVALFSLQLKVDMLCHNLDRSLNLSIFGHIQLQDLNLITPKKFTNKVVRIQHTCLLSSRRKKEGKEYGTFIKGVIPTH